MSQAASKPARSSVPEWFPADPAPPPVFKAAVDARPRARGKFIYLGGTKHYIRGVTYGTFRPGEDGCEYQSQEAVERDFAQMAANGINAIRVYTVPPRWLLDSAQQYGIRVMVGLPWEQHVTFLDDQELVRSIEQRIRAGVRACAGHPAIFCYTLGNEIPAPIVRWHGRRRVAHFIERLYHTTKNEDADSLVTYVNYPSTEYLELPFLDLVAFNVYLEHKEQFEAYLGRLQNVAGDRPLVMAELGLDSRRHGLEAQAHSLDWQVRSAFAAGCAGTFVFGWTDEWHRGGHDIRDWDFGLTDRDRRPKPALTSLRKAYIETPFPKTLRWPRISVIVCSYNGERTIRDCLEGLCKLQYPNYEVIVVNDGSTDRTEEIAREYGVQVISTENRGLSSARNTGLTAASGEIVAYTDDDAYPDPHWLTYLAATFMTTNHAGAGGPNLAPPGDGPIADCVANAPGGPVHVLLSDGEAEHIPGCNMAFRKAALEAIGGFDPGFRVAGDDVDVCWRLQQKGMTLGFSAAAVVWHHRRNSVRAYWRQQKGYGRAEALLERKWPEKYNELGHLNWAGRVYGKGLAHVLSWRRARIYQGTWGSAPFQSIYQPAPDLFSSLTLMPEWYLVIALLATLSALGLFWRQMLWALPLFAAVAGVSLVQAGLSASRASFTSEPASFFTRSQMRTLTAFLHLLQPLARLCGRVSNGLSPWRSRLPRFLPPLGQTLAVWSERWKPAQERVQSLESMLRGLGAYVYRGGDFDRWDLEVRGGVLGHTRIRIAIEEHGGCKQMVRLRLWPGCGGKLVMLILLLIAFSAWAALDRAWGACAILAAMSLLLALRTLQESAAATATVVSGVCRMEGQIVAQHASRSRLFALRRLLGRYGGNREVMREEHREPVNERSQATEPDAYADVEALSLEKAETCADSGD